ncbi:hypothetical protein HDV00_011229 [Rhizophlyctis rosea]|nr:hypothetical protein HDV00_011229 [Rhizophlyctis rosea]
MSALPSSILKTAPHFLTRILSSLASANLPCPPANVIDHICYRTSSPSEYMSLKADFLSLGTVLTESLVGGREISTFKLHAENTIKPEGDVGLELSVLELPSPKTGRAYSSGWEHVEVVVGDLDGLIRSRPDITWDLSAMNKTVNRDARVEFTDAEGKFSVKFHEQTLEEVIKWEKEGTV